MDTRIIAIGGGVLVAMIAGYVVMLSEGIDGSLANGVFLAVLPVITGLFTAGQVKSVQDSTKTIAQNTNGVLSAKVAEIAEATAQNVLSKNSATVDPPPVSPTELLKATHEEGGTSNGGQGI